MNQQTFIATIAPMAIAGQRRTGVLSSITIAQGALESAWGAAAPGNNLFGIKGNGQEFQTTEYVNGHYVSVVAGFRTYDSWEGSVIDHSNFLVQNGRYRTAGFFDRCKELDYVGAARSLQNAGYATDPKYAAKLVAIIQTNALFAYDILEETKIEVVAEEMLKQLDQGVAQTLIDTYLKPSYDVAKAQEAEALTSDQAAAWNTQKNYYKWLADSLRDASGLPRE